MKKKLLIAASLILLISGCSKQPSLENANEINATSQNVEQNVSNISNKQLRQETNVSKVESNMSVETENLNTSSTNVVKAQNISLKVSEENNNQDFAKKLSKIVIYFDFDKYNIRPDQMSKVEKLAKLIKSNPSNYTVRIEGNCDEWGTEEYNYALGLKRANSVKNALIKLGVDPKKLTVISYGELNPVCTAHARWCWRLNRRDNFTYLP